jgi:hypothetical protein
MDSLLAPAPKRGFARPPLLQLSDVIKRVRYNERFERDGILYVISAYLAPQAMAFGAVGSASTAVKSQSFPITFRPWKGCR